MDEEVVAEAKRIIAKAIGFEESELEPGYWNCGDWGLHLLMFDTDWNWLMYAVIELQKKHPYQLVEKHYDAKKECLHLAEHIKALNIKIKGNDGK